MDRLVGAARAGPVMAGDEMKLTMDGPASYQVKVPGELDDTWSEWVGGMTIGIERQGEGPPVTTLTGRVDQAGLLSALRRLYSLGLPLISVVWLDWEAG